MLPFPKIWYKTEGFLRAVSSFVQERPSLSPLLNPKSYCPLHTVLAAQNGIGAGGGGTGRLLYVYEGGVGEQALTSVCLLQVLEKAGNPRSQVSLVYFGSVPALVCISITVIKHQDQSNLGRKGFT